MANKMNINHTIIPGKSIGGISIGENVFDVRKRIQSCYNIEVLDESSISINDKMITLYHGKNGIINEISCNSKFNGVFDNKLWAGITVEDVIKNTSSQVAWSGFVQVDNIKSIGLSLPNECDDFEIITDFLDLDFVFEELWIY